MPISDLLLQIIAEMSQEEGRREREQRGSFTASTLLLTSLSVIWVTASWSEINYSKRQRMLASTRYHQENHQLCRRFLISLSQSSAPETVAPTHLIEVHLTLDLMICALVSGTISAPVLPEALNMFPGHWTDVNIYCSQSLKNGLNFTFS